ncbi:hypothetical protein [Spiroplasma endosymbiont of Polydrusus formosus]|uniref:hypothetical protein n=1 Tax=Spiroplasma endosymbiont of Polydrusus formosus TaxID=3139326 RepID=UPI0035B53981
MKKLLALMGVGLVTFGPTMALVSCNKNDNWNSIPIDSPILPVEVIGFAGINFKTINPQNNKQTIPDILDQLTQLFIGTQWKFEQLTKNYKFNNQTKPVAQIDLHRNGQYELNFNDGTNVNTIKINKTVMTSNHLTDKVKSTNLGQITDTRPKTILIAIIFNNMQLISELDKFGEFFIGEQVPEIWNKQIETAANIEVNADQTGATLNTGKDNWLKDDNPSTDYYGSVNIRFSVVTLPPPAAKEDLGKMKLKTSLGKLPKVTILQVMMMFISVNFVSQLKWLSVLLNDLYLDINIDQKEGIITTYVKSDYYTGKVNITFS